MTHSPSARWLYRGLIVLVALMVSLDVEGSAADETAASCCDQSSMECTSGQNVGDKGSCPGTQVCVQFVDKCKKKHPGVLCMCGDKESSLELSSTNLTFNKKSRRAVLTVSNPGNVALNLTILESGDTDAFDIRAMRRCKKKIASSAERQEVHARLLSPTTATVPPQGCTSYRVHFTAKKKGVVYTEQLGLQTNATTPPTEATVTLIGSVGNPGSGPSTTTSTTNSTTTSVTTSMGTTTTTLNTGGLNCTASASLLTPGGTILSVFGNCSTPATATSIGFLFHTPFTPLLAFTGPSNLNCQITSWSPGTNNYYVCTGAIAFPGTVSGGSIQGSTSPGPTLPFSFYVGQGSNLLGPFPGNYGG